MTPTPPRPTDKKTSGNPATQAQIAQTVKQQREQKRQEKLAEYQKQLAKRRRSKLVWWTVGSVIAIGVIAAIVASIVFAPTPPPTLEPGDGDGSSIEGIETFENTANHVEGEVDYAQSPPTGGDHNAVWLNCGIYDQPVPNVNAVHALEHGAVWVTYDADAVTGDELAALESQLPSSYIVLSPVRGPGLPDRDERLERAAEARLGRRRAHLGVPHRVLAQPERARAERIVLGRARRPGQAVGTMSDDARGAAAPRRWIIIVLVVHRDRRPRLRDRSLLDVRASAPAATPSTASAEAGFSRDMQVHHAQAIAMAMEIYRKTDDDELRVLSYDIATGQAGQRGEMFDWLVQWGLPQAGAPMMAWMAGAEGGHDHGGGRRRSPRTKRAPPWEWHRMPSSTPSPTRRARPRTACSSSS